MERRDFLKFMGVSTASLAAATALVKLPEVEPKIILLEPKKIIIPGNTGLVIKYCTELIFRLKENGKKVKLELDKKPVYVTGHRNCDVEVTFELGFSDIDNGYATAFDSKHPPTNFTFNFDMHGLKNYSQAEQLNGRRFIADSVSSSMINNNISTVMIRGFEVFG